MEMLWDIFLKSHPFYLFLGFMSVILVKYLRTKWLFKIDQVKKQQLEPNMEPRTGSELGKEYVKAVYYHPAYLTYMQSTLCKMLGWMKHSWNQNCWGKYQ